MSNILLEWFAQANAQMETHGTAEQHFDLWIPDPKSGALVTDSEFYARRLAFHKEREQKRKAKLAGS